LPTSNLPWKTEITGKLFLSELVMPVERHCFFILGVPNWQVHSLKTSPTCALKKIRQFPKLIVVQFERCEIAVETPQGHLASV